ncbi:hypothetical protein B0H11DRAFT_1908401 [Mycena galericulata]|nr:hypothetical protein B0H11DRAFT_1908401 [Mycena galericulata]
MCKLPRRVVVEGPTDHVFARSTYDANAVRIRKGRPTRCTRRRVRGSKSIDGEHFSTRTSGQVSKSSQARRACMKGGSAVSRSSAVSRRVQGRRREGRGRGVEKGGSVAPGKRKGGIEGRRGTALTMESTVSATGRAVSRREKATSRRWWWYENKRHFELRHAFPRRLSAVRHRLEKIYGSPNALKL